MKEKNKKFVVEKSSVLAEAGLNLFVEHFKGDKDMHFREMLNIILSTYLSACANVLQFMASTTGSEKVKAEINDFIMQMFKSVPDAKCEVEGVDEH